MFKKTNQKGQSLVEMALTMPILILILAGILDLFSGWPDGLLFQTGNGRAAKLVDGSLSGCIVCVCDCPRRLHQIA